MILDRRSAVSRIIIFEDVAISANLNIQCAKNIVWAVQASNGNWWPVMFRDKNPSFRNINGSWLRSVASG